MATREVLGLIDTVVRIPPRPSDVEEPSLGVTDGGMLGRGLPSQGCLVGVDVERAVIIIFGDGRELVDLVVGQPGSFAREEANFEELCQNSLVDREDRDRVGLGFVRIKSGTGDRSGEGT